MKTKFSNPIFYQNDTTIVCKLNVDFITVPDVNEYFNWNMFDFTRINSKYKNMKCDCSGMHFSVVGKAKLCPGDIFDRTVGERLAESKAKEKAFNIIVDVLEKYQNYFYDIQNTLNDSREKFEYLAGKEYNHQQFIIDNYEKNI